MAFTPLIRAPASDSKASEAAASMDDSYAQIIPFLWLFTIKKIWKYWFWYCFAL